MGPSTTVTILELYTWSPPLHILFCCCFFSSRLHSNPNHNIRLNWKKKNHIIQPIKTFCHQTIVLNYPSHHDLLWTVNCTVSNVPSFPTLVYGSELQKKQMPLKGRIKTWLLHIALVYLFYKQNKNIFVYFETASHIMFLA